MKLRTVGLYAILATAACACGSSDDSSNANPAPILAGAPTAPVAPPGATKTKPACVISADCPTGTHCDLEECVQDCNAVDPCTGQLTCSTRGRCLPQGQPDSDPTPSTTHAGVISASPGSVALTEQNTTMQFKLQSTSTDVVRYRVELDAPYLRMDSLEGEFSGTTTLVFRVDPTTVQGHDAAGSVKVFTTLGDVVVDTPIHVGVTGSYEGTMTYNGGPTMLGDARLVLDMLESNGDLQVRADSGNSLLFPKTASGETMGRGSYTVSDGIDVTLTQLLDASFGAKENPFNRPLGRSIQFKLKMDAVGTLTGTFVETIFGLFAEPITSKGSALLQYKPHAKDPQFTVGASVVMPSSPDKSLSWTPGQVFGWSDWTSEATLGCFFVPCTTAGIAAVLTDGVYVQPMTQRTSTSGTNPFDTIAANCTKALSMTSAAAWNADGGAKTCSLVPVVASAVQVGASFPLGDSGNAKVVSKLVSAAIAPSLLVAKNDIVTALSSSFVTGITAEKQQYDNAAAQLVPIATWMTQPSILEFLRAMPPASAKGDDPTAPPVGQMTPSASDTYPAGRALADLFATIATIDGERARIGASDTSRPSADLAAQAQTRSLLTYLEAMTVQELVRAWGSAPDSIGSKSLGLLGTMNTGYVALLHGADAFGVPRGFVPFVYDPAKVGQGATNFEQMLAMASVAVGSEKEQEGHFTADNRAYEVSYQTLQTQIGAASDKYDSQLKALCGSSLDPNTLTVDTLPTLCVATGTGQVGSLSLVIQDAQAKLSAQQSLIQGAGQKIAIDQSTLEQTQEIDAADVQFIQSNGQQLALLTLAEGTVQAAIAAAQIASNASLFNAGAPVGEAVGAAGLELLKAGMQVQQEQLQTDQQAHAARSAASKEYIEGMAAIQKELIDLGQLSVDMHQASIGVLESFLSLQNALDDAKTALQQRQRFLTLANQDPTNDPSFRLLRDQEALTVLDARAAAQQQMDLAAGALQYEVNMSIAGIDGAVLNAHNGASLDDLSACLLQIFNASRVAYGTPQDYVTTVSVRQMLGIIGPRKDTVTGATLSEGDQFRQILLKNDNLDGNGGVGITFATDLQSGNGLWSSDVCNDRVATVQAQLVGDFLGDNQAQINLTLTGGSVMRECGNGALTSWSLGGIDANASTHFAVIQAGVNTFGDAPPNTSLFGQSVARASWKLVIPGGAAAPSNSDVDLTHVDDVVLKFGHKATPESNAATGIDVSCLGNVGR